MAKHLAAKTIVVQLFLFIFHHVADGSALEQSLAQFTDFQHNPLESSKQTIVECRVNTPHFRKGPRGLIQIKVLHESSPVLAAAFVANVNNKFYDNCYFFRVMKNFVAQFGLSPPDIIKAKAVKISKSDVKQAYPRQLSNTRGTLSFAGLSPQVFINLGNNARLDNDGRPFAVLDEASMNLIDQLYMDYKDGQGQVGAVNRGEVDQKFPEMSWVETCSVRK